MSLRATLTLAFALGCALSLGACGAPPPDEAPPGVERSERGLFSLAVTHAEGTFHRGVNRFSVRAWDASGRPADLKTVRARMPAHTHADALSEVLPEGDGFRVPSLLLDMAGRWEITLRLSHEGREDDAILFVYVD